MHMYVDLVQVEHTFAPLAKTTCYPAGAAAGSCITSVSASSASFCQHEHANISDHEVMLKHATSHFDQTCDMTSSGSKVT